jgi:ketosteroid isomerase-like protein
MDNWLEDYFQAWNDCDTARIAEYLSDEVLFEDVAHGHSHNGKQAATRAIAAACGYLPKNAFELHTLHSTDTHWYVEWTIRPPGARGVTVGTRRDGLIDLSRDYWNPPSAT